MPSRQFISEVGLFKWATRYAVRQFDKRILKRESSVKLPTGLTYRAPLWDPFGTEAYVTGANVDWGAEALLAQALSKDGSFIDVGAHTGYYTLYMLPLVEYVYAFEPDLQSFEVLNQYQLQHENLHCFRKAVSKEAGTLNLQIKGRGYAFIEGTASEQFTPQNDEQEQIAVVALDDYIDTYQAPVTGIKIDVDGPDLDVLEGAVQTIKQFAPVVLVELSSAEFPRLFRICRNLNYQAYAFVREQGDPHKEQFALLSEQSDLDGNVKMIFLVPDTKTELFEYYRSQHTT